MADHVAEGFLPWFRRHERTLAGLWLVGSLLVVTAIALPPVRERLLDRAGLLVNYYEERWARRVAAAEALVKAHDWARARPMLERLDAEHPATNVRHGRDKERELVLRLLARSYEGEGKSGKAMATWERLVAFDSLNYTNRLGYAQAAERMLSGWALAEEARDGYASVLRIFPIHLPSVRGYVDYYMDRGEFIPVSQAYRAYLDAFFLHTVTVALGDSATQAALQVDGRTHRLELALVLPPGQGGRFVLRTQGMPFLLERVTLLPARVVGRVAAAAPVVLDTTAFGGDGLTAVPGGWLTEDTAGSLVADVPPQAAGVGRVVLDLRLYKPMDKDLWLLMRKSYLNLLDPAGFLADSARSLPFPDAERADRVLTDLPWAREGLQAALRDQP